MLNSSHVPVGGCLLSACVCLGVGVSVGTHEKQGGGGAGGVEQLPRASRWLSCVGVCVCRLCASVWMGVSVCVCQWVGGCMFV